MSNLVVDVCPVKKIRPHPNADRLEIVEIRGWQCVVPIRHFYLGQLVVYFPPDTLLSKGWTEYFGVSQYCQVQDDGKMRIRKTLLRGEPSFGLVVPVEPQWRRTDNKFNAGDSVIEFFGAEKYEPPMLGQAGDILGGAPEAFHRFTEIENLRNWPDILWEGEEVIITEKIHGTCCRIGAVDGVIYAGSKNHARKMPDTVEEMRRNFYWFPYILPHIKEFLSIHTNIIDSLVGLNTVTLFGETYGKVQNLRYGRKDLAFRCFGLSYNGKYMDYDDRISLCKAWGIPTVPEVYRGPFDLDKMIELADGKTLAEDVDQVREGIVIQPVKERTDPRIGRVILKCVGTEYLASKHSDKDTTDI